MYATVMTTPGGRVVVATVTRLSLVVVISILAVPLATDAQPAGAIHRIGYLGGSSATVSPRPVEVLRQGLREFGWVEGQNIVIESRFAEGRFERLPDLAAELVRLKVDVIVVVPTPSAVAAKNATGTIPIVMVAVGDPVEPGLVASLARPGGNVTGLSFSVGLDTAGKGLELFKETVYRPQGPPCGGPLEPAKSVPRACDRKRESLGAVVGSGASSPGGPRS